MVAEFASLIDQNIHIVPSFTFECGVELRQVPVAYKTWGTLNESKDNVMVICHAFTGSADVEDWWGPLMGRGKAFDPTVFFIFCANVLGSPYGSASPVTINPETGKPYGPDFPRTTIRDDVRIHKLVLDHLGVRSIALAIGGSMGGMAVLEYPLCTPPGYVRHVVPLATSARHSAWCISWGEAQRASIFSDPRWRSGRYAPGEEPAAGLAAARMAALLTYRSRDSFEGRFGRRAQVPPTTTPAAVAATIAAIVTEPLVAGESGKGEGKEKPSPPSKETGIFSAQSYLRYQGDKFTARFDANCYVHITHKMDTHDLARDRETTSLASSSSSSPPTAQLPQLTNGARPLPPPLSPPPINSADLSLIAVLATLPPRALVISIQTDGLFTPSEQELLASHIPEAELVLIESKDGHDGFLLEFEAINRVVLAFLKREFSEYYASAHVDLQRDGGVNDFEIKKTSLFGEAEKDIARW